MKASLAFAIPAMLVLAGPPARAEGPLHVDITQGVSSPLLIAVPDLSSGPISGVADGMDAGAALAAVVRADLLSTGLYRLLAVEGRYSVAEETSLVPFGRAGAQALVLGRVRTAPNAMLSYDCALYDVFGARIQASQRILVSATQWRRAAHRCADLVFAATTGDPGHFDTRVLVVRQDGTMPGQSVRLVSMDYDGANPTELTQGQELVSMPRFAPGARSIVYLSFDQDRPVLVVADLDSGKTTRPRVPDGVLSAPRFSPDGRSIVFSLARDGDADIYKIDLATGATRQLTSAPGADTSPCYSPDGASIVFESDRSGEPQLYLMKADGSAQKRISFGQGAHASPIWSPQGDLIAFTASANGRLRIGVMKSDGSKERLISDGTRDEDPSWAVSGRALMFQRTTPGAALPAVWMTDLTGRVERQVTTGGAASEPAWSGRRP